MSGPPRAEHVLFVFLDGVGIGPSGPANPLAMGKWPHLNALAGGQAWTDRFCPVATPSRVVRALDATLGVEGLPQSGTGQAALFSGINAPRLAGRHYGPFPHSATRVSLRAHNIFRRVTNRWETEPSSPAGAAEPVAFLNAYPPRFFAYAERTDRWTVTTRMCLDAGVRIRTYEDLQNGQALAADLTGQSWGERLGLPVAPLTPAEAGERALRLARYHAFTLFEYFLTDKAGHSRDAERARQVLHDVDAFVGGILSALDVRTDLLVVSSDHGNLEDLSTKSHTRHPVPCLAYGAAAEAFSSACSLTDVVPAVLRALFEGRQESQGSPAE